MKIDSITVKDFVEKRVAEHEIFLSFNNDEDAECFLVWWGRTGQSDFKAWAEPRDNPYE